MRHFFGYRANGMIASTETYGSGWPQCNCHPNCGLLADPDCRKESVVSLREERTDRNPEIVGFMLYDCPCSPGDRVCNVGCVSDRAANYRVDVQTKAWVVKPVSNIRIDGSDLVPDQKLDMAPTTTVDFKIIGPEIPNGQMVRVVNFGMFDVFQNNPDDGFDLEFQGGETPVVQLTSPPHGGKAGIAISGLYIRPQRVSIRGWTV